MDQYTDFARVYDTFMDETPYHDWAGYIHELIAKYGVSKPALKVNGNKKVDENINEVPEGEAPISEEAVMAGKESAISEEEALEEEKNLVVELGCGTGSFTTELADMGYDIMGIDNSSEMLQIAMEKNEARERQILYLEQDMRELELYSTAGTFVSVCDSINYLTDPGDVVTTLEKVNNYLYPGGIFIFDFNTVHKYRDIIGDTTISEDREDCAFIWDNYYDEESCINEYDLAIFVREDSGLYRRFTETHMQRGYSLEEMKELVEKSGMTLIDCIDADSHMAPDEESERIYIVAGKNTDANSKVN
ncbi:class I SAM-dependent DNA methyltransferase [Butyrivibrio sp. MC2013]|uniref:class I SAM-dependent DNA methyltransferase n=1 Tax=Butyrivibrio sp. MC2013 TaxID=1280686 RepID=UPI00041AE4E6|nr:class I SAM-dependent methyltransferase [Butyrivibrio sp. MC2013]